MKFCLVIPGDSETTEAACRVVEGMDYKPDGDKNGMHFYRAGEKEGPDIIVLDREQYDSSKAMLVWEHITKIQKKRSIVLLCEDDFEDDFIKIMCGTEGNKCRLQPFSLEDLV